MKAPGADIESRIASWQNAGLLDAGSASRILDFERENANTTGMRWQILIAVALGAVMLAAGILLFIAAHWAALSPAARFTIVLLLIAILHAGGVLARMHFEKLSIALHAVGTVAAGAGVALAAQIFNVQEDWPTGVLLAFLAALIAWLLLGRDQIQSILCLLLLPAWIVSEWNFHTGGHIGSGVTLCRILVMTSVLYLSRVAQTRRKILQIVITIAAVPALIVGASMLAVHPWQSWGNPQPLSTEALVVGWLLVLLPVVAGTVLALRDTGLLLAAFGWVLVLPHTQILHHQNQWSVGGPGPFTFVATAVFTITVAWWGVRNRSRLLVNVGVTGVCLTVLWFYFSDVFGKLQRSLALVLMGALFLLIGWGGEQARRRLMARMSVSDRELA